MNQDQKDISNGEQAPPSATPEASDVPTEGTTATDNAATDEQPAAAATDTSAAQPDADVQSEDVAALREALQQAEEEAEQYRDQALRAAAEADNVRKRAQRDVDAARKFALEKFVIELLGVRDSLDMGLKASEEQGADADKLAEGMELTGRMLATAMEKFGVEQVNPEGETFDPEQHEAVSMQETDAQGPNTVVSVMQKGYTLNGRVLRAAMVVVAKAPADGA